MGGYVEQLSQLGLNRSKEGWKLFLKSEARNSTQNENKID